jgi:hypothetical protein
MNQIKTTDKLNDATIQGFEKGNDNWTMVFAKNGDLNNARNAISDAYSKGATINNILLNQHGAANYIAIAYDNAGEWIGILPSDVDEYARIGQASTIKANSWLSNVYVMASCLAKGGNFVFNSCNAGRTDKGPDLGASLYKFFSCANKEINVLLPRWESNSAYMIGTAVNIDNHGWSVTNKWTNGGSVQLENSSLILQKRGAPIKFSDNLKQYLNK